MRQCFAEPENAFQVKNWYIILDFFVNFWLFSFNFFFFGSFTVFCQKSVNIAISLAENSYSRRLFLPRCNFVQLNCIYANPILVVFSDFRQFFVCFLFVIARNRFLCNMRDFNFVSMKIQSFFGVKF